MVIGIYARVSTEEQAKHGYSLQDQVRQCRNKARTDEVIEYVDSGFSGEFLERPGLDKLREDVRNKLIDKVVIYDPDRWSRNLMNQLIITDEIERNATIEFVNGDYDKSPEGTLFYQMRGAISEFEKAKINERMSRGRKEKAQQGRVLRDFQIYGYKYDSEQRKLVINPDEAAIVQQIFDLFTNPQSDFKGINGIALYLTETSVPTKRGKGVWHKQVVRQILMNRTYTGEFYQNKWNTEGMHGNKVKKASEKKKMTMRPKEEWIRIECPAIISDYQFEHAQKLLSESKRRYAKDSLNQYLLSGLIRCGDCENTMTGRKGKSWGQWVFEYTDKKNTAGAKHPGCGRRVKCSKLDDEVWERIVAYADSYGKQNESGVMEGHSKVANLTVEQLEEARVVKEIVKIQNARKRLLKLFAMEGMDDSGEAEIKQQLKEFADKEKSLNERLEEVKAIMKRSTMSKQSEKTMQEAAEFYWSLRGKGEYTFEDKKKLIRMAVREIRVYADRADIHLF